MNFQFSHLLSLALSFSNIFFIRLDDSISTPEKGWTWLAQVINRFTKRPEAVPEIVAMLITTFLEVGFNILLEYFPGDKTSFFLKRIREDILPKADGEKSTCKLRLTKAIEEAEKTVYEVEKRKFRGVRR